MTVARSSTTAHRALRSPPLPGPTSPRTAAPLAARPDPAAARPGAVRLLGTPAAADARPRSCCATCTRQLVRGRRYNRQATALTKQGRLAVYPSSTGQEACEVAAALALRPQDWLFPSYRDTLAVVARGVDPVEALTLLRGDWHTGYDPREHPGRAAVHPAGHPAPARRRAWRTPPGCAATHVVALAMVGDGGTSEGDFHEALNFAAVLAGPGGLPGAEQRLRDLRPAGQADRRALPGPQGGRLRHAGPAGRRQRRGRRAPGAHRGRRARPDRRRPDAGRGDHLPDRRAHQRRRRHPLPRATTRSRPGGRTTRCRCWRASCARAGCSTTPARRHAAERGRGRWPPDCASGCTPTRCSTR